MTKGKAKHPHNADRPEPKAVQEALERGDIQAVISALSPRQRRFAEEYVIDFVGNAAALRAGYSTNYPDQQASTLLRHKGVQAYIAHLTQTKESQIMSVNPDYIIQEIVGIVKRDGARDGDKLRGLELLARHLGMFIDRQEITGKDGEAIRIEQQKVQGEAEDFLNKIRRVADKQKEQTIQ